MHATTFRPGLEKWLSTLVIVGAIAAGGYVIAAAPLDPFPSFLAIADPAKGEKIFLQCKACHVSEQGASHTVGPNLWGVVGRPVGSQTDFPYSECLKAIGGTWGYDKLSQYLLDLKSLAPATRMVLGGIERTQERADLIAYLRTLSDQPLALPPGPGRQEVFCSCNACHSLMLVTQQGMSRERWDEALEWMVEEKGMSEIEDAVRRDLILDYLSTHFSSG